MTFLKTLICSSVIVGAVLLITVAIFTNAFRNIQTQNIQTQNVGGLYSGNFFYANSATTSEHSSMWLETTALEIMHGIDEYPRQFARITISADATGTAYIWQATSTDLVTTSGGIPLTASTSPTFTIDADNLYRGNIQGISDVSVKIFWIEQ